jgi:ferredoxin-nitrate reductase
LGFAEQFAFTSSAEVYAEFVQLTRDRVCEQTGISHARLAAQGPIQWPEPDKKEPKSLPKAVKRLYTNFRFSTPDGRARFVAHHSRGLAEPPDPDYPFVLTTGRLYGHWHTQTRTGRIEKIRQMHPNPFIEIHPRDATKLGIQENDLLEVRSRRGTSRFPAKVTKTISPGTVFVPIHWGFLWADKAEANALTHPVSCPQSLQPELKACAVQLVPVATQMDSSEYLPSNAYSETFSPPISV